MGCHSVQSLNYTQLPSAKLLCVHITHKNVTQAFDRLKNCLMKIKLNLGKTEFILFHFCVKEANEYKNLNKFFPVNILGNFFLC